MTNPPLSLSDRILRGLFTAFVAGALALVIALRWAFFSYFGDKIRIPLVVGIAPAGGFALGYALTDYGWKRILRVLLPFSKWP